MLCLLIAAVSESVELPCGGNDCMQKGASAFGGILKGIRILLLSGR